jgi:TonB family protein
MKRTVRRRHLLFFSTSLAAHILFVLVVVGILFIVSDTPRTNSDHPLVVSLDRGDETGDISASETTPMERIDVHPKESALPDTSVTKVSGNTDRPDGPVEAGDAGGVSGIAAPDAQDDPAVLSDYIRSVRARINRHKRYPPAAAKDGIEGTVTVSFILDRRGTLLDKGIAAGSGHPTLDEAALVAVGESSPFPPFPDGLNRETLLLRLPINYRQR